MRRYHWLLALAIAVPLVGGGPAMARDRNRPKDKDAPSAFGSLKAPSIDKARADAKAWLKSVGKDDAATQAKFDKIWKDTDRSVLDRVADTLALGNEEAAKLLAEVADTTSPAPMAVPTIFTDAKQSAFFRANLALAYAKAWSNRRVYEESLATLKVIKPEDVADPAGYFFHRAVAEHALLLKTEATRSIVGLLEDVSDAPDRYRLVAMLMHQDMQGWRDKDLGEISRKMDNIERRLELARGGPHTQKIQKDVVARLDEIIKKLENQAKGSSQSNGGS